MTLDRRVVAELEAIVGADAYAAAGVDDVVTVDPGCHRQVHGYLRRRRSTIRAVHLADLLAAAGGRPLPRGRRWRVPRVPSALRQNSRTVGASGTTASRSG